MSRKKMAALCLIVCMMSLSGCGASKTQKPEADNGGTQKETAQEEGGAAADAQNKISGMVSPGYVPAGSTTDKNGNIVTPSGDTFDQEGHWVVPEGGHVNADGQIVDKDGNLVGGGATVGSVG